jgi:CheY-like chemotaxis protein
VSASPRQGRILIASDRPPDAGDLRQRLAEAFESVEVSTRAEQAVPDFERVRPDVLVLAFERLEKAREYGLNLLRLSQVAQTQAHRSVVLCASDEVPAAFELCKKDYFDDYVPYWPQPHDGHRLTMAVWNALRRLAAAREPVPGPAEIASHARSAQALGTIVDGRLDQGLHHVAAAQASLAGAERQAAAAPAHAQVAQALAQSRASLAPLAEWAQGFRAEVAPHAAAAQAFAGKLAPLRPLILVVEDDSFAARLIGKALEAGDYEVEFAEAAPAVLAFLRSRLPQLVLMDVNLPGMDGLALTEWLKAKPALAPIPVLMLTGEATRETIARSRAAGAADFIVKPFAREALLAKVAHHLA